MRHKGYDGNVQHSETDDVLHGKVLGIQSLVSYEGQTVEEIKAAFVEAVDDYLELCESQSVEPEEPRSGTVPGALDMHDDENAATQR